MPEPTTALPDCFIVRTQPKRERWAAENCFRQGYSYYLPEVTETVRTIRRGRRSREFRTAPLFPSYLFVSAEGGQWHPLLRTFGVIGLIPGGSGGNPAIIRSSALQIVRSWAGEDGFIRLPKKGMGHGDLVRITRGAYAGFVGLVQGLSANERVQVLLDYMGRKVPFLVRESDLEVAA